MSQNIGNNEEKSLFFSKRTLNSLSGLSALKDFVYLLDRQIVIFCRAIRESLIGEPIKQYNNLIHKMSNRSLIVLTKRANLASTINRFREYGTILQVKHYLNTNLQRLSSSRI